MWAALAGAAIGAAGSIYGGIQAANEAKKAEEVLRQQRQKNDDWYGRRYYQDYTQTAEAQSLLNQTREQAQEWIKNAAGRARVGGGSAEEVAAAIEQSGKAQADTARGIAAQATQYKNGLDTAYRAQDSAIDGKYYDLYNQRAANNTAAANAAMQAGMGLVTADGQAKMNTGKGLFENMFKA